MQIALCNDLEVRRSLLVEEYKAIRAKSAEARDNQQSIIQWSLAAVGLVTAGVLAGSRSSGQDETFRLAVAFAFCTVVPLILLAALAIWLSEVSRMLRAARFLREREHAFGAASWSASPDERADAASGQREIELARRFAELPIMWEGLLATEPSWRGRADLGFVAVVLMYGALSVTSCSTGIWALYGGGNPSNLYEVMDWCGVGLTLVSGLALAQYANMLRRSRTT